MIYQQTLVLQLVNYPVAHVKSKLLVVITHALYSAPRSTLTFGNVATYSIIPPAEGLVVDGVKAVGLGDFIDGSVSRILPLMLRHCL